MAEEYEPGFSHQRSLEERVARLEAELADLRRELKREQKPAIPSLRAADELPRSQSVPAPPPPPTDRFPLQRLRSASASFAPAARVPQESLETRLGSQVFNRIAIVLLLIGTAYGMKLAIDRGLLGPPARVIIGLVAGAGIVLWSERFRRKGFPAFSYSLKALGSGVLYLALWAAFRLYHLVPAEVGLALMILVTAWNAFMAWAQDSELLAAYALAGGFATPTLLSTGGNHEIFLFTYLLALDLAIAALVRLKAWPRLLIGAYPLTVAYFIGWYSRFYAADELLTTAIYIALFTAAFASVVIGERVSSFTGPRSVLPQILSPLGAAAFSGLGFYSVLEDSGHHAWLPWLMLALSAVYLLLMRLSQPTLVSAIHLSIAVVFLTIAIPLKASGSWITVGWLVEAVALVWVATRLGEDSESAGYASAALRLLATGSLALGFCGVCFRLFDIAGTPELPFFNNGTGTALTGIAAFAGAAWLASRARPAHLQGGLEWPTVARISFLLIPITGVLLAADECLLSWSLGRPHPAFHTTPFLMSLLALLVLAGVIATALRFPLQDDSGGFWRNTAALSTIAFNLIALLAGVREVSAWFAPPPGVWTADAGLQQSLAISTFLMLYGAALLTVGFWRRSSFLRWQALILLLFTISKAFLYDMRNLSQGYRVVSLLALGALLLAVSFAYQKDWLNLRTVVASPADPDHPADAADHEAAR